MKRLLLLTLAAGCASGYGEAASGTVELSLFPAGTASGGVRFERALLSVAHVELVAAEPAETPDDGHGHSHLVARNVAEAHVETTAVDLLGAEQPLGQTPQPAGTYEAAHVELALLAAGDGAGCSLFAAGSATLEGQRVPVRICVPGGQDVDVAVHLDVAHDEVARLRLFFAVNDLLHDVALDALEREADGGLRIDATRNAPALETLRANVAAAISAADHDPLKAG